MPGNAAFIAGGSYASGNQMEAFDKLPPTARRALAEAQHDWPTTGFLARWRRGLRGYKSGPEIARTVAEWDRNQHRRDVKRGLPGVAP